MRKILIVEDEAMLREAYELIVSSGPYIVHTAKNGQEGLAQVATTAYDLILLDLMMPIIDGLGFLEQFRPSTHPETKVIVISNVSVGQMLSRAKELGAYKTMLKSDISPRQLMAAVRHELEA
jgi:CheY-like chemotaxis protein